MSPKHWTHLDVGRPNACGRCQHSDFFFSLHSVGLRQERSHGVLQEYLFVCICAYLFCLCICV